MGCAASDAGICLIVVPVVTAGSNKTAASRIGFQPAAAIAARSELRQVAFQLFSLGRNFLLTDGSFVDHLFDFGGKDGVEFSKVEFFFGVHKLVTKFIRPALHRSTRQYKRVSAIGANDHQGVRAASLASNIQALPVFANG